MTFFLEEPQTPTNATFAGGVASIGDIYTAARDQMLYVDNTTATAAAMERAIDERNAEVETATGTKLDNPYRRDWEAAIREAAMQEQRRFENAGREAEDPAIVIKRGVESWQREVEAATATLPDRNVADRLNRSLDGDALAIARASDERLATLLSSRSDLSSLSALLAGGVSGSLRDPVTIGSLAFGGGPGGARTVLGRVLTTATKEMLINGAMEAAVQPLVQDWRARAGLDHGLDEAIRNVVFASFAGAGLGAIGQGAAEALRPFLRARDVDAAAAVAAMDERTPERLRQALAGDTTAARAELAPLRETLPAEARGALAEAERLDALDAARPAAISPEHHDLMAARAEARAEGVETEGFVADPAQVERIVERLAPKTEAQPAAAVSLIPWLRSRGGLIDDAGELKAIGAEALARKSGKRGEPDRRMRLDMAREAAEEAGYIGRAGDFQTTTVADLLDAIRAELGGERAFAREDGAPARADIDGERRRVESAVAEVARLTGPDFDDDTIAGIAETALRDNVDAQTAIERHFRDHLPDLPERARMDGPPAGGIDQPGAPEEDFLIGDADLKLLEEEGLDVPFFDDDRPMSVQKFREEMERFDNLATVVGACRA